jgi:transposase InsO family protein
VKFAWIKQYIPEFEVACMCNILNVSRSGFYAWQKRPPGRKTLARETLLEKIHQAHVRSRCLYGSPRVEAELVDQGVAVCVNTVAKYMRQAGICSKIKRRFRMSTTDSNHGLAVAPNRLDRCFTASGPNRTWCCDITYVPTAEGFLYLAAVIDVFSRRIVGWAMGDHLRAELCTDALSMALARRAPAKGLLHHSDRGVQYACHEYQQMLSAHGIEASMSRTGNCYDNALMESFWGTLKTELTHHEVYATRDDARQSIFEFIEVYYNRQRRHSAIGYQSPEQFEASLN